MLLQADLPNPFLPGRRPPDGDDSSSSGSEGDDDDDDWSDEGEYEDDALLLPEPTRVDLDGICDRILAFPRTAAAVGRYGEVFGLPDDRVMWTTFAPESQGVGKMLT